MNGSVLHFFCLLHFFSHYSFVVSLLVSVVFKVEIIASALHERWRAGRKQPDGTYAPHKKIYERAVCDTAALTYTELPALAQGVLRASARCVCVAIDEALRDPMSGGTSRSSAVAALVGDGDFVESAAALHHGHWKKHADRGSDPAMLVPYAKLADRQKESSRIIVATALEQYFDECLAAEVAAHDRDEAAAALAAEKEKSPDFGALTFETELQSMNCIQVRARSYRYASLLRFAVFRSMLNVRVSHRVSPRPCAALTTLCTTCIYTPYAQRETVSRMVLQRRLTVRLEEKGNRRQVAYRIWFAGPYTEHTFYLHHIELIVLFAMNILGTVTSGGEPDMRKDIALFAGTLIIVIAHFMLILWMRPFLDDCKWLMAAKGASDVMCCQIAGLSFTARLAEEMTEATEALVIMAYITVRRERARRLASTPSLHSPLTNVSRLRPCCPLPRRWACLSRLCCGRSLRSPGCFTLRPISRRKSYAW